MNITFRNDSSVDDIFDTMLIDDGDMTSISGANMASSTEHSSNHILSSSTASINIFCGISISKVLSL